VLIHILMKYLLFVV